MDCEAFRARRGWEIPSTTRGNDRSAYERLLAAVDERRLNAVVTWHNDRLRARRGGSKPSPISGSTAGVRVAVVSGGYDLTNAEGRFTARIGAVARKEWEDRSRGVRREHLELAEQGRPASHLGWGVRNEAERELAREARLKGRDLGMVPTDDGT